jgi:hypothetical protein
MMNLIEPTDEAFMKQPEEKILLGATSKMNKTKNSELDQYLLENIMWERTLEFYSQQNAFLKTRLSISLDNSNDKEFVNLAEKFQASFINNDESIKEIQRDIDSIQRIVKNGITGMQIDGHKLSQKHSKLRSEIRNFEKSFTELKQDFNYYIDPML